MLTFYFLNPMADNKINKYEPSDGIASGAMYCSRSESHIYIFHLDKLSYYHMHHIHFLGLLKLFWSCLYEHLLMASLKQGVFLVLSMPETIVSSPPFDIIRLDYFM